MPSPSPSGCDLWPKRHCSHVALQSCEQPSPSAAFPSSHSSPGSNIPLPHGEEPALPALPALPPFVLPFVLPLAPPARPSFPPVPPALPALPPTPAPDCAPAVPAVPDEPPAALVPAMLGVTTGPSLLQAALSTRAQQNASPVSLSLLFRITVSLPRSHALEGARTV
jgi:hypothetical protein